MFLTLPAMLFLVQAVMFFPAIFFIAGIAYMVPKSLISTSIGEMFAFIAFFGVHLAIYFGIFFAISAILAKLISLIPSAVVRYASVAALCTAMALVTLFPVYGGGGHGPMRWVTWAGMVEEIERSYGSGSTILVYGGTFVGIGAIVLFRWWRRQHPRSPITESSATPIDC
jgi:hypothetical protein